MLNNLFLLKFLFLVKSLKVRTESLQRLSSHNLDQSPVIELGMWHKQGSALTRNTIELPRRYLKNFDMDWKRIDSIVITN